MNCGEVKSQIVFYVYGEISSDAEERVESHLAGCAECQAELARHRKFLEAVDQRDEFEDDVLLAACRTGLRNSFAKSPERAPKVWGGWLENSP